MEFYDIYIVSVVFLMEYLARLWVHNDIHKNIIKADDESKFLNKNYEVWKGVWKLFRRKILIHHHPPAIVDLLAIFRHTDF